MHTKTGSCNGLSIVLVSDSKLLGNYCAWPSMKMGGCFWGIRHRIANIITLPRSSGSLHQQKERNVLLVQVEMSKEWGDMSLQALCSAALHKNPACRRKGNITSYLKMGNITWLFNNKTRSISLFFYMADQQFKFYLT